MRILLDENTPADLADFLAEHHVDHVASSGLQSLSNGELLAHARQAYDCLVTLDRGIPHQHNHTVHALIIVVVRVPDSRKATVMRRGPALAELLKNLEPGSIEELPYEI